MVQDGDVESYKQIKEDLDDLRNLVEKSELWVYKPRTTEEDGGGTKKKKKKAKEDDDDDGIKHLTVIRILFIGLSVISLFAVIVITR